MIFKVHLTILTLFFLSNSIIIGHPALPQESTPTVIQGVIKNYEKYSKTKVVKLQKSVSDNDDPYREAKVHPDGSFELKFHQFDKEKYILSPFPNTHIFTYPGDSVQIIIDLDHAGRTTFKGNTRSNNILLNKFYQEGIYNPGNTLFIPDNPFISTPDDFTPLEVLRKLDEVQLKNDKNLVEFVSNNNASAENTNMLKAMMLRNNYENLLEYGLNQYGAMKHASNVKPELQEELVQFFNLLTSRLESDIERIAAHISTGRLMDKYMFYLMNIKLGLDRRTLIEQGNVLSILDLLDQTLEDSRLKDHLLYRLNTQFMTYNLDYYLTNKEEFLSKFSSDTFRKKIQNYIKHIKLQDMHIEPMKNYNLDDVMVGDALREAIKEAEGKKIFIDFWATWCGPCLEDMKKSKEAVTEAEAKGDVVVIYVCVDNNESARKNFINSNQIPGKHITIPREATAEIMANFGNSGYPFQVIVGSGGSILAKGNHYRFTLPHTQKILSYERP